ncbi:MAG: ABC transporter substrate-binding protein, partial [Candidatus Wallbacteria bacterium]|nr:ABC transporter substrate-binding protein [Candidatus Wallbacteria bacterium]
RMMENMETVEIVDDFNVRTVFRTRQVSNLSCFLVGILPEHVFRGKAWNNESANAHPIGTGPFRFKSRIVKEEIVLEAFPGYFGGRPFIDKYVVKIIPDSSVAFNELKSGLVDMMDLNPDQFSKQGSTEAFMDRFNIYTYPRIGDYSFISFNMKKELFQDRNIRIAMNMAIDRQKIIDDIMNGYAQLITGPFPPTFWGYDGSVEPVPFSPEGARKALEQSGWIDSDSDGILDRDGKRLAVTISAPHGSKVRELLVAFLKRSWETAGIAVSTEVLEWHSLIPKINEMTYDVLLLGFIHGFDHDPFGMWHSSMIPDPANNKYGFNHMGFVDEEVDRILEAARQTLSFEQRREYYHRFHRIVHDNPPQIYLYSEERIVAVHKRVRGIMPSAAGLDYNITNWYVPENDQKYPRQ